MLRFVLTQPVSLSLRSERTRTWSVNIVLITSRLYNNHTSHPGGHAATALAMFHTETTFYLEWHLPKSDPEFPPEVSDKTPPWNWTEFSQHLCTAVFCPVCSVAGGCVSYSDAFSSVLLDANGSVALKRQQRQIWAASMLPANYHKN